jgi:hypothetical protein
MELHGALTFLRAVRFRPNLEPEAAMHREIVNDRLKLMYHRLVVRRLAHDSSLIDDARKVVAQWQTEMDPGSETGGYARVLLL